MFVRLNPDEKYRFLERKYQSAPNFYTGIKLLREYLRIGLLGEVETLLDVLEPQYPGPYTDLGAESVLIEAHLSIGRNSRGLCDSTGAMICRYSKMLIWDTLNGYSPGTSQKRADNISKALVEKGLIESDPSWYDDRRSAKGSGIRGLPSDYADTFARQKSPHYAVGLFHPHGTGYPGSGGFLRIVWNNIYVSEILDDYTSYHGYPFKYQVKLDLMLEDQPDIPGYQGPRINLGNIPSLASGGRRSISTHFTKRVNLDIGASRAVDVCCELARGVYFAKDIEEEWEYSGTDTYQPLP